MLGVDDQRTSCPGFLDDYGIWNNGFECPPLANQIRICCGSDSRRYCCTLGSVRTHPVVEQEKFSTVSTPLSFVDKLHTNLLSLPVLLSCLLVSIIFLLFIFIFVILCFCSRRRTPKRSTEEHGSNKQTLLVDHFPFSPPHHQMYFNDTHPSTSLLHPQTKDTLTTTTTTLAPSTVASTSSHSSSSARVPSDLYFHDWKEFFVNSEQPMNVYPTMSSHHPSLNNEQQSYHRHPSSSLYHDYCQQDDIIV